LSGFKVIRKDGIYTIKGNMKICPDGKIIKLSQSEFDSELTLHEFQKMRGMFIGNYMERFQKKNKKNDWKESWWN
jgi:hypothetical protein